MGDITELRVFMQDAVSQARAAKLAGNLILHSQLRELAVRRMLAYIGNGYITRLWNELESAK